MSKKGVVIASAVAAAMVISGCTPRDQSMPKSSSRYQSGHSSKMGKMGGSSCKGSSCRSHSRNSCSGNSCSGK